MGPLDDREIQKKWLFYTWIGLTSEIPSYIIFLLLKRRFSFSLPFMPYYWHDFQGTIKWITSGKEREGITISINSHKTPMSCIFQKQKGWASCMEFHPKTGQRGALLSVHLLPLCRPPKSKDNGAATGRFYYWNMSGLYQWIDICHIKNLIIYTYISLYIQCIYICVVYTYRIYIHMYICISKMPKRFSMV